ncbi:MAG: hypothetical protein AAGA96_18625 [Verrucomicrobiota bacterium]
MALTILALVLSLYLISVAADHFVTAASAIGRKVGLKDYLIGSLIVGIGTSLPELMTSLSAVNQDQPSLVAPNVFGTVITNVLCGLGASVLFLHLFVGKEKKLNGNRVIGTGELDFGKVNFMDTSAPVAIFSVIFAYFLCQDGEVSLIDSILLCICYLVFMTSEVNKREASPPTDTSSHSDVHSSKKTFKASRLMIAQALPLVISIGVFMLIPELKEQYQWLFYVCIASLVLIAAFDYLLSLSHWNFPKIELEDLKEIRLERSNNLGICIYLAASLFLLYFSGETIVWSVLKVSEAFGISAEDLTATVIALGTSLPDIVVAIIVARKLKHEMLVGHIVQSNIFDVFLITGLCGLITPLPISEETLTLTIPFCIGTYLIMMAVMQDNKVNLTEGILMLVGYIGFVILVF